MKYLKNLTQFLNESKAQKFSIIPEAVSTLKQAGANRVHTREEFDKLVNAQKFFNSAHSHCFYTEEEYQKWSKQGCKYEDEDSEASTVITDSGDLVGVWDDKHTVGYVLAKDKPVKKD